MEIMLYDKVILKDGRKASIVEIYKNGKAFEADIEVGDDCITDTIYREDIFEVLK